jgi:glycosyltransferase involved in cell wall biosynthesis
MHGQCRQRTASRMPPLDAGYRGLCHRGAVHLDVLHVLSSNRRRGAETFGYELHMALAERGLRSGIRCLEPSSDEQRLPVRALGSSRFSPAGLGALRREAPGAGVVLAHGSNTLLACGAGMIGLRVPFIYLSIGDPRYWAGTRTRQLRARWLIGRAAAVVAISPGARDVLIDHYRLPEEAVHVIPNGRSASRFSPPGGDQRRAARGTLNLSESADVVAMIGALGPEKRVDVAIAALGRLPDTVLIVAGEGPERPMLEALADHMAPGRVHFLGATDAPDTVLAAADLVALSSDSEGVPGVLIEAGLTGLPVVATDVGWIRDVVRPGETGLLVPPGEPEEFAAAVRVALEQQIGLGSAARAHCLAEFEMEHVTDKWQRLIKQTASRRRSGRA